MKEIRLLNADEIELRVAQCKETNGRGWCNLLLYKDARVDQRILDQTFGNMNWQRTHQLIGDRLYCTVSVWDEDKGQWISKQDVGTESNTEKEKGQASDSFKRACFNIGIGRELYTAPDIFINLDKSEYTISTSGNGRLKTRFYIKSIEYTNGNISGLVIVDGRGNIRYEMGKKVETPKADTPAPAPKKKATTKKATDPAPGTEHKPAKQWIDRGKKPWTQAVERQAKGDDIRAKLDETYVMSEELWAEFFEDVQNYKVNNNLK